ncbi:MAG TPA: hypothetical protein VF310_16760, partial [Vicinamibacteria bacterium]
MSLWAWRPRVTVRRRRVRLAVQARAVAWPAPRVRRRRPETLPAVALDRPAAFRALFRRPEGAPFLAEGSPERALVELLDAPSLEAAADASNVLADRSWERPAQGALFARLRAMALGETPLPALWGEEPAADALRLRLLRAAAGEVGAELPEMRWGGFLRWAGARLAPETEGLAAPPLVGVAAASLAAAGGHRFAFEALAPRAGAAPAAEVSDALSLLALRCALEDVFLPSLVEWLVPAGALRRSGALPRPPWAAALLALRAFDERENVPARVHLTAALVAADLRERVSTLAGRAPAELLRRRWWSAPPPEGEGACRAAVAVVRARGATLMQARQQPWPRGWGGPDGAAVVHALEGRVGGLGAALELFLDDRLAVAAVYAAIGYLPSAAAQLAAAEVL